MRACAGGSRGHHVLAGVVRLAARETQWLGAGEAGVGAHPGGGGTERLPPLVGRGRALEIVLGADDFDGDTAAQYGYVNRALPDSELAALSMSSRAGSPHSTGVPSRRRRTSSTRLRCHPPTGSLTASNPFRKR